MGKPLVGEVVVLPFPQTDLQADKRQAATKQDCSDGHSVVHCRSLQLSLGRR